MQLNTFFCRQGVDSNLRFASINIISVLLVSLFHLLLAGQGFLIALALFAAVIAALSGARRLQGQKSPLVLLPGLALILLGISYSFAWPLLLGLSLLLLCAALVLVLRRPQPPCSFQGDGFGYRGPRVTVANLGAGANRRRVEPRFEAGNAETGAFTSDPLSMSLEGQQSSYFIDNPASNTVHDEQQNEPLHVPDARSTQGSLTELLNSWSGIIAKLGSEIFVYLKAYPKAVVVTCVALLMFMTAWLLYPLADDTEMVQTASSEARPETMTDTQSKSLLKTATMPDGFSVQLDGDVLALKWLGERGEPRLIWSLATAKGDKSCQLLTFNDGSQYRPIEVNLLADTSTVARFSPLDTQAIVKDIAMRGSLKLCGYQFSLKGSQAALAKEAAFRPYL